MENEENIQELKIKLNQTEENYKKVVEERDRINLELVQTKQALYDSRSLNDRLLRIIENLSEKGD